jgi:hypothetical protein
LTDHPEISNKKKQQSDLYCYLDDVIAISQKKLAIEKKADSDRQAWARIIVSAVQAYGRIIELAEIDDLKQRIETLEEQFGVKGQ